MYAPPAYIRPALWIPAILYQAAIRCRNDLYASGVLKTHALHAPVISIGNLTLGGTGKTPLVIHVANLVADLGATPVLLTRGYRRTSHGMQIISPGMPADAADAGDEPALVRRRCPRIWLGVHHDRYSSGRQIARSCQNPVFILDDGFQHRRLRRDLDIVVIDSTQRLQDNRIVPLGSLREPLASLKRAQMVIVTGGGMPDIQRFTAAPVFCCVQEIRAVVPLHSWRERAEWTETGLPGPVFLVAGIGNPSRFLSDVQKGGFDVRGTRWLRDHSRFVSHDWYAYWREAQNAGASAILTTEKDAVKITDTPDIPIEVAVQSTRIPDSETFDDTLAKLVRRRI